MYKARELSGHNKKPYLLLLNLAIAISMVSSCAPSKKFLLEKGKRIGVDKSYVRVLIDRSGDRCVISSDSRIKITELKSRKIKYDGKGRTIYFYPEMIKQPVVVESWQSPLVVNGKRYRGMIELHNLLGKINVINVLRIDEYLFGVVPSEILSNWNMESLKAQAVTARTYAYYHIMKKRNLLYDLDATNNFQVYRGLEVETDRTNRAVAETSGEILTYKNQPIIAYFHSTCGGKTADDKFVWDGNDLDYITGIPCRFCKESPDYSWKTRLTLYEMRRFLRKKHKGVGKITGISFKKRDGRVVSVVIRHRNGVIRLSGNNFRLLFPDKKIKSLLFVAKKIKNGLILHGHGWGHGVGMCQWGAKGLAESGAVYREILKFYYKGVSIFSLKRELAKKGRRKPVFSSRKKSGERTIVEMN
jgi:stage II sporulation protein D